VSTFTGYKHKKINEEGQVTTVLIVLSWERAVRRKPLGKACERRPGLLR
jgi:hypothetical protein